MKTTIRMIAAAAMLALSGCVNEEPAYKSEPRPEMPGAPTGWLAFDGIALSVIYDDQTDIRPDDTSDETQRPATTATRTAADAADSYLVAIYNEQDEAVAEATYGELKARTEPMPLPVGNYRCEVRSEDASIVQPLAWEHPLYGATSRFQVLKDETTALEEIVCTMTNIKVTMMCSADLRARLSDQTVATVTLGSEKAIFAMDETRAAYFLPSAETDVMEFRLEGTFVEGDKINFRKQIAGVKAGEWRKIALVVEYADKGNAKFDIVVDTFVMDEEIVVNGTADLWEPVMNENPVETPAVVWKGHDLGAPFQLLETMFAVDPASQERICTEPVVIEVAAGGGIGRCEVTAASTNEALTAALAEAGLGGTFDLAALAPGTKGYETLTALGLPAGEAVGAATSFDLGRAMPLLYPAYAGTHTFALRIVDALDTNELHVWEGTLTLVVDPDHEGAPAPTIVWRDHDIDRQYVVEEGMQIVIDVEAPAGIRAFDVEIQSVALAPYLSAMGLPERFDLCSVEGTVDDPETLAGKLHGLGFPVNDQVLDQTSFDPPLDITQFAGLLKILDYEGDFAEHNFKLTVTDNNGQTTSKTVQLKVVRQ